MKGLSCLVEGDLLARDQGEGSPANHSLRVVRHERRRLHMQIFEHLVLLPSADEADDVDVHLGEDQCVGAPRP